MYPTDEMEVYVYEFQPYNEKFRESIGKADLEHVYTGSKDHFYVSCKYSDIYRNG